MARQSLVSRGLLIFNVSRSHSDTPHPLGLLWTNYQPIIENSDKAQQSKETDIYAPGRI
jgi:hypothetical protein